MVLLGCTWILLLLPPLIIVLVNEYSYGKSFLSLSSSKCQPNFDSSCGSLPNISYPFCLKHDPKGYGLKQSELACENNSPILYLLGGKYYVLDINYENETIRVVDVGIDRHNCSSLPLHSLSLANLLSEGSSKYYPQSLTVVMLVNCERPIKSGDYSYVDLASGSNSNCFNNYSHLRRNHSYMLVGDLRISDAAKLCTVEAVVLVAAGLFPGGGRNLSLLDIHSAMANGFELDYGIWSRGWQCPREWSYFHCLMEKIGLLTVAFFVYDSVLWCGYVVVRALIGLPLYLALLVYKFKRRHAWMNEDIESFLQSQDDLVPISYPYSMISKMTMASTTS